MTLEEERARSIRRILVTPVEGGGEAIPALRMGDAAAARGEAVFLALALRKPLVERFAGEERRLPPESLARPWLEETITGPEPEPAPAHRAVTERTADGARLLVVRKRHAYPARAHLLAEGLVAAGALLLVALQTMADAPLALLLLVIAFFAYRAAEALLGTYTVTLTPDTLTLRERFIVERTLYAMRWERLHDVAVSGGRGAALRFVSSGGDFALRLPETAARDLAARIVAYVREASKAGAAGVQ